MPFTWRGACADCEGEREGRPRARRRPRYREPAPAAQSSSRPTITLGSLQPARIALEVPARFDAAVAALRPRQRQIFALYYDENLRQTEIAERMKLTRGAVSRIIERIRAVFTSQGLPEPKHPAEPQEWGQEPANVNTRQPAA